MELVFIDTPSHGYLKVSVTQLSELGLSEDDFSNYSFKWKNYLLLEEDCDAPSLLRWIRAKHIPYKIIETKVDDLNEHFRLRVYNNKEPNAKYVRVF